MLTLATCSSIQYLKWETLEYTPGKPSAPHIVKPQEKIPESCHSLFFQHIICLAESAWKTYRSSPVSAVFGSPAKRTIGKTALIADWFNTKIAIWDLGRGSPFFAHFHEILMIARFVLTCLLSLFCQQFNFNYYLALYCENLLEARKK